jgi:hypothetical protein
LIEVIVYLIIKQLKQAIQAMDFEFLVTRLSANAEVFRNLFKGLTGEQAAWKPAPEKWSLLEIINHLYDEEREDFRARVNNLLTGNKEWAPIDPVGWVTARNYAERDLEESLNNFLEERKKSIEWLRGLEKPDWNLSQTHPAGFEITAEQMLSSWLAHDIMHIRQIITVQFYYLESGRKDYLQYAGNW